MKTPEEKAEEEGIRLFTDLQETMKRTTFSMQELAESQEEHSRIINEAASRASQTATEASEAFVVSKPRLMGWVALCAFLLVGSSWLIAYWFGHHDGLVSGNAQGYRQAITTNAAASWANTQSGRMAKQLDDMETLQPLATCKIEGFHIEKTDNGSRWCVIAGTDGKFHGWLTR